LEWRHPGRIILRDVDLPSFDAARDVDGITSLEDAVSALMRMLAEPDGRLLVPFVGDLDTVGDLMSLAGQALVRDDPPIAFNGLPVLAGPAPQPNAPPDFVERLQLTGDIERIVTVIDVDIGFANARFRRTPEQTRIAWFWDMEADAWGSPPFAPGRFLYGNAIDAYIARLAEPGTSELDLYRDYYAESYVDPASVTLPSVYGHGTHVLDVAQGGPNVNDGTAIFAIQLPRGPAALNDGKALGAQIDLALWIAAAQRLLVWAAQGTRPELVVNLSVGGHSGRHDGETPGEQFMETMLADLPPAGRLVDAIYLAAGNSRETRTHRRFAAGDITALAAPFVWRIRPDDGTPNFLEIWLPPGPTKWLPEPEPIRLAVAPPSGQQTRVFDFDELSPGTVTELKDADGAVLGQLAVEDVPGWVYLAPIGSVRRRILLTVTHTRANARTTPLGFGTGSIAAAGDWHLEIQTRNLPDEALVGLWIGRDVEILRSRTGARQSVFADIELGDGPQPACEGGTINDLACGASTCVIGAFFDSGAEMTGYSSEGIDEAPPTFRRDFFPTAAAMAEESRAHRGILAAGFFSGGTWRQGGTSVAAPLALRYIMANTGPRSGQSVRKTLVSEAKADEAGRPMQPLQGLPNRRMGFGRLDATTAPLGYPPRRRR
jgi:hypothetical protein